MFLDPFKAFVCELVLLGNCLNYKNLIHLSNALARYGSETWKIMFKINPNKGIQMLNNVCILLEFIK